MKVTLFFWEGGLQRERDILREMGLDLRTLRTLSQN